MTSLRLNRSFLQQLADTRVEEARTLLDNGHYSGAYYLAGYAVECGLKACIAKQVQEHDFPDLRLARKSHSHDIQQLVKAAGLESEVVNETTNNPAFATNWLIIQQWDVESRYEPNVSQADCQDLYTAVTDGSSGILPWIKERWERVMMLKEALTNDLITASERFISAMNEEDAQISMGVWKRPDNPESPQVWRLLLVLPVAEAGGRLKSYEKVVNIFNSHREEFFPLTMFDIEIASHESAAAKQFREATVAPKNASIKPDYSSDMGNGFFFGDSFVYCPTGSSKPPPKFI